MERMRSVSQDRLGGPEVLQVVDRDVPEPRPTEIRVRVAAAGVNPVDWKTREGRGMAAVLGGPPFSVGWDVAGVVDALGMGVTRFAVGDRVLGMPWFPRQAAAYSDFVTGPARQFVSVPDGVDTVTAAATPLPATTAWQLVHDVARLTEGDRVLVLGAGGGVGQITVQLARLLGAEVFGTDAADRLPRLAELGLEQGHDFRTTVLGEVFTGMDVVLDFIGGEQSLLALPTLREGGLIVSVPSGQGGELPDAARAAGCRSLPIIVEPDRVALEGVAPLLGDGRLAVDVGATYRLEDVATAHADGEAGRVKGRIVLTLDG